MNNYLISKLIYQYHTSSDIAQQRKSYDLILKILNKVYDFDGVQANKFLMSEISKLEKRNNEELLFNGILTADEVIKLINDAGYNKQLNYLTLSELFFALSLSTLIAEGHANRRYKWLKEIGQENDALAKVNVMKESSIIQKQDDLLNDIIKAIEVSLPFEQMSKQDMIKYLRIGYCEVAENVDYSLNSRRIDDYYKYNENIDLSYYYYIETRTKEKTKKLTPQ